MTVSELLAQMKYSYPHLIISINGALVPEQTYATQPIPDEADVRVIHLIAGG